MKHMLNSSDSDPACLNISCSFSMDMSENLETASFANHDTATIILICIYIPIFLLATVGNIFVLIVILLNKKMRSNSANYFLVNLAVADILVAVCCIPTTVAEIVFQVWIFGEFMCKIAGYLQGVYVGASVLTIVCMSADRFLAIRYPMKSRQFITVRKTKQLIGVTWLLSIGVMVPLILVRKLDKYDLIVNDMAISYCIEQWPSTTDRQIYDVFLFCFIYIIPGTIVLLLYSLVGCRLWVKDTGLGRQSSFINNEAKIMLSRRRLALMMIIISVLFAVCWLPYYIINILMVFSNRMSRRVIPLYPFALLLGHSNSAQNPILYCFMHRRFKECVVRIIKCQCDKIRFERQITISKGYTSQRKGEGGGAEAPFLVKQDSVPLEDA